MAMETFIEKYSRLMLAGEAVETAVGPKRTKDLPRIVVMSGILASRQR
jgi:hypothetical protein